MIEPIGYFREQGFLWIPKRTNLAEPGWVYQVVRNSVCPDQRLYRRMTRAERIRYYEALAQNQP